METKDISRTSGDMSSKQAMTRIRHLFNKACTQYHLLSDGDRILLALSGGKDSMTMAGLMAERARIFRPSIHVEAAHVIMDNVPYEADLKHMQEFCQGLGLRLNILHASFDEVTDTRKTRCFLCARYRRKMLMEYAQGHGFNKVALGHHMDDFLATMLMNVLYEGSFHSMSPSMSMQHYPLTLIRPMCLIPEQSIADMASAQDMVRQILPCPYEDKTRRSAMESLTRTLCSIHAEARQSMWHALEKGFTSR
ncbi:MAG: tRNA 2-thiocytidine biosynthesis TtcA family protein [Bacteroides sp.]|nr:tRNA 2-thiocytidine biosynthesis TtcA family protein [Bacteroides sp.]MCM1448132.1 tRNA 2-thiocytidine biosynthesis TtcA family protein [Bacteroides sp.]